MENAEEVFHFLEEFSKRKSKTIPQELNDYLAYVARTGDPVYQWPLVKCLFKEKLLNVLTDFYESTPVIDIPTYPNVDPFNYDILKNSLLERLDSFASAPFTIQRICELLTYPRKQYNRVDKFMRAVEKNILVVSTREPGIQRHIEQENGELNEPIVNGSDNTSEYNVDVEMEDVSWKENSLQKQNIEPQPSSSETRESEKNVEEQVQGNLETPMDTQETGSAEQVIPTESQKETAKIDIKDTDIKCNEILPETTIQLSDQSNEVLANKVTEVSQEIKENLDVKTDIEPIVLFVPEIKVDDAETTEQKLNKPSETSENSKEIITHDKISEDPKSNDIPQALNEDSCSSSTSKEDITETKIISEVLTSSEESSSSSDNTDGNSNSPKTDSDSQTEVHVETQEKEKDEIVNDNKDQEKCADAIPPNEKVEKSTQSAIQTDNYSISDVSSEIQQLPSQNFTEKVEASKETSDQEGTEIKSADNVETQNEADKELPVQ